MNALAFSVGFVPGGGVNIVGALLVATVGIIVLAIAPGRSVNRAFCLYATSFGLGLALTNFWIVDAQDTNFALSILLMTLLVAGAGGAMWLAHVAGRREDDVGWTTAAGAALGALAVTPAMIVTAARFGTIDDAYFAAWNGTPPSVGFHPLYMVPFFLLMGGTLGACATLTLRAARLDRAERVRFRGLALLAAAMPLFSMFAAGALLPVPDVRFWAYPAGVLPLIALLAAAWIAMSSRPEDGGVARNVALLLATAPLLGITFTAIGLGNQGGTVRAVSAAILAYGILRHQVLGVDVKLRWTISKSTVAAVFVTVFFLASETAQAFLGETLGSTYVGIAAAGALVFAMAPLQRAAERFAARAVPLTGAAPASGAFEAPADRELSYRHAVELALHDRVLTRDEERRLMQLAHHLGIPPARAAAIHDAVEAERVGGSGR